MNEESTQLKFIKNSIKCIENGVARLTNPPFLKDIGMPGNVIMLYRDCTELLKTEEKLPVPEQLELLNWPPRNELGLEVIGNPLPPPYKQEEIDLINQAMYSDEQPCGGHVPRTIWPLKPDEVRQLCYDYLDCPKEQDSELPLCFVCDNSVNLGRRTEQSPLIIVGEHFHGHAIGELLCNEQELGILCKELMRQCCSTNNQVNPRQKVSCKQIVEYRIPLCDRSKMCKILVEWVEKNELQLVSRVIDDKSVATLDMESYGVFQQYNIGQIMDEVEYLQQLLSFAETPDLCQSKAPLIPVSGGQEFDLEWNVDEVIKGVEGSVEYSCKKFLPPKTSCDLTEIITSVNNQMRPTWDFTDSLWNALKYSSSLAKINKGMLAVLQRLPYKKAQLMPNNPTHLAKIAVNQIQYSFEFDHLIYYLMEAGYNKLFRDLDQILSAGDICNDVGQFLSLKKPELSFVELGKLDFPAWHEKLTKLRSVAVALEVLVRAFLSLKLKTASLQKVFQEAMQTSKGATLHITLPALAFSEIYESEVPFMRQWTFSTPSSMETTAYVVSRSDRPTFEWCKPIPFQESLFVKFECQGLVHAPKKKNADQRDSEKLPTEDFAALKMKDSSVVENSDRVNPPRTNYCAVLKIQPQYS